MQAYLKLKEEDEELYEIDSIKIGEEKKIKENKVGKKIEKVAIQIFFSFVVWIKQWLNIITVKQIYTGFVLILPFSNSSREVNEGREAYNHQKEIIILNKIKQYRQERRLQKCIPKIKKIMKKYQITSLVLSEDLKQNQQFMQQFSQDIFLHKVNILNGKGIMPYLIKEIIEFITQKQNKRPELEDLYILVNQDNSFYRENIAFLSQHFKTINIVTPCLLAYQKFANQLEEKQDVILTVTNNKKKSLRKAKWIVNFDVPAQQMKKYTIYRLAAILYVQENEIYQENGFDGIHICQAGIDVSNEIKQHLEKQHLLKQCDLTVLYESFLETKRNLVRTREKLKQDEVKVVKLYGSKGTLQDEEYHKNIA